MLWSRWYKMAEEHRPNPAAMTPAELATVLTRAGATGIGETEIAADVVAGAPTNSDGTMNLVHYAAWLVQVST